MLALSLLLIAAYCDYIDQGVYDILSAGFCISCGVIAFATGNQGLAFLAVSICMVFLAIPDLKLFGGADGAILSGLLAIFGPSDFWIVVLCFSSLALVIYYSEKKFCKKSYFVKGEHITLIPIITLSLLPAWLLIEYWPCFL